MFGRKEFVLALLVVISSYSKNASAANGELIRDTQLLSKTSGWVLAGNHLLWSNNLGTNWQDVTPPDTQRIDRAFFLNQFHGWVIMALKTRGTAALSIAQTINSGLSWSIVPFTGENVKFLQESYSQEAYLTFLDSSHGWLILKAVSSSNFSIGDLFSTIDGGKSWTALPNPPIADSIRFISPTTGWLAGGPGGFDLYVTRDGGQTWKQQQIHPPDGIPHDVDIFYNLPYFPDGQMQNGTLPVTFAGRDTSSLVLYSSSDSGQIWNVASSESNIPLVSSIAIAPVDSTVMRMFNLRRGGFNLGDIGAGKLVFTPVSLKNTGVQEMTFFDPRHGWAILQRNRCYSSGSNCYSFTFLWATSDGGVTATDRTPPVISPERIDTVPADRIPPPPRPPGL